MLSPVTFAESPRAKELVTYFESTVAAWPITVFLSPNALVSLPIAIDSTPSVGAGVVPSSFVPTTALLPMAIESVADLLVTALGPTATESAP